VREKKGKGKGDLPYDSEGETERSDDVITFEAHPLLRKEGGGKRVL